MCLSFLTLGLQKELSQVGASGWSTKGNSPEPGKWPLFVSNHLGALPRMRCSTAGLLNNTIAESHKQMARDIWVAVAATTLGRC